MEKKRAFLAKVVLPEGPFQILIFRSPIFFIPISSDFLILLSSLV
jgi:hypothetical protein